MTEPFTSAPYAPPALGRAHLARVKSVDDPDRLARVQVIMLACDRVAGQGAAVWARVAVPFAGGGRGAFLLPDVGDEVLVVFVDGDRRYPIVVGSLWNGHDQAPERLGGDGQQVDRWTFTGRAGTRISITEEKKGNPTITLETPGKVSATLSDASGGSVVIKAAGSTITINTAGVTVESGGEVKISAGTMQIDSGSVTVNAAMSRFSGVVQCDTLIATTVVGTCYTPGAGNVW